MSVVVLAAAILSSSILLSTISIPPPTVTWEGLSPEDNATTYVNSMPIGNGGLAANVFVDNKNISGSVLIGLLIADQRSWNEAGEFVKVGKVTVDLTPSPWASGPNTPFKQVLDAGTGTVRLDIGNGSSMTTVVAFVDALKDVIVLNIASPTAINVTVTTELLRPKPFQVRPLFHCRPYNVSADFYVNDSATGDLLGWAHANTQSDYITSVLRALNLESLEGVIEDRVANRSTVAIWRFGRFMVPAGSSGALRTVEAARNFSMVIAGVATSEQGFGPAFQ
ncbi:hypothetical protein FOZ61_008731 [Perkinsus olseni]|uniref:DUF5703 domain-containing protein n=1 Tax=Perkinsus olseni TaxID=32597 RepID=A0A7J6L8W4_PEROL|nr:hypothetical protein FOZ61_008731 [Perkinsus olseni]KAF4655668.1 hypothetical protein FOL46_008143 [Perkinsus olseni]